MVCVLESLPRTSSRFENVAVSDWLQYQFNHFDDVRWCVDKGRIFGGKRILERGMKGIEEGIRLVEDSLVQRGMSRGGWLTPQRTDPDVVTSYELYRKKTKLLDNNNGLRERWYGIINGRWALQHVSDYLGKKRTSDLVVGCELFLAGQDASSYSEMHRGFLYAIERGLEVQRRISYNESVINWERISGGVTV